MCRALVQQPKELESKADIAEKADDARDNSFDALFIRSDSPRFGQERLKQGELDYPAFDGLVGLIDRREGPLIEPMSTGNF